MKTAEYRVIGKRAYFDTPPGETFEARVGRGADQRAMARGDIELVRLIEPEIQPGSFQLPEGWLSNEGKE